MENKKVFIKTFGCQMNVADSNRYYALLKNKNITRALNEEDADIIIINSCAIRAKAANKVFSLIGNLRKLKQQKKDLVLVLAGCIPTHEKSDLKHKLPDVDYIVGPDQFLNLIDELDGRAIEKKMFIDFEKNIANLEIDPTHYMNLPSAVSSFVSISVGCNNYCSYCVVPFTRGPERSRSMDAIINEIKAKEASGTKEIMLLGQNVNSYGKDLDDKLSFAKLLKEISKISGILRIRFMTSHPKDLSEELMEVIGTESKICKCLHLPVQSGSNEILKKMNRPYTVEHYYSLIERLNYYVPNLSITTDFICGFPTETIDDFGRTIDLLNNIKFSHAFIFPYSKREGTKAFNMPDDVPLPEKMRRVTEILKIQNSISKKLNEQFLGKTLQVLVDQQTGPKATGRSDCNRLVTIEGQKDSLLGKLLNVKITKIYNHNLTGEII